ncbi:hypothetical protein GCM10025867_23370 [Frondihabitans sucicola]|uniref:Uncharacterized protein n=1 Tax=Frondihabitans sucicola TaxID=1268041 RepID=A0ABM8GNS8_9MICO|nr:hypothetical protein [Frondihabitans sucicola]BDZ50096.1 hypothetical protein GCM10025867_23370 [Frondihabitans sucicola]
MTERDEAAPGPAPARADGTGPFSGKDVDGLITLPGVHSVSGVEKAGTGESDDDERDAEGDDTHLASDEYPRHPTFGGPPSRHR